MNRARFIRIFGAAFGAAAMAPALILAEDRKVVKELKQYKATVPMTDTQIEELADQLVFLGAIQP